MGNKNNKDKKKVLDRSGELSNSETESNNKASTTAPKQPPKDLNIFIIGDFAVGKTSLALQFVKEKFDEELCKGNNQVPHADIDPLAGGAKLFPINDQLTANLKHFDTAGNEKFRMVTITQFNQANIIFICFAINNSESFNQLPYWHREATNNTRDKKPLVVLVGTKQDLASDRRISQEEIEKFCESVSPGLQYFEVSAKTGHNVKELYSSACAELIKRIEQGTIPNPFDDDEY